MRLTDISIRNKVLSAFSVVVLVAIGLGAFAVDRLGSVNDSAAEIRDNWLPATGWLGSLSKSAEQVRQRQGQLVLSSSASEVARSEGLIGETLQDFDQVWKKYEPTVTTSAEMVIVEPLKRAWATYLQNGRQLADLAKKNRDEAAQFYMSKMAEDFRPVRKGFADVLAFNVDAGKKEADKGAEVFRSARMWILGALAVAAGLCALMGYLIIASVSRPIVAMTDIMRRLAGGNRAVAIDGIDRKDEIGKMAGAVLVFKESAIETERLREAQAEGEKSAAEQRKRDMRNLADAFESAVGEIVETVSTASTELEASASTLRRTAERSQTLTTMVASASEEASTNVQSVASASEELASSITEISRQIQESARVASEAVQQARATNERVGTLSKAASRIGDVVELINTIAGQTNLLALNATIEAARAGDAGRGFAVVASEVKALAEQTAKATGEIGQQITSIQGATDESVAAIRQISGTIERLSEISSTIAAAIEEQGAATQEISRNVQQAAQGTHGVSTHITDVQQGATETGSASSQLLSAAQSLSYDSNRLKLEVGKFLSSVRAA